MRTVEGTLTEAIGALVREPVRLACAGRTDAGVHAWGQVVSFATTAETDRDRLRHALNRRLAPEIVVRSVGVAPADFDARHSARAREYRYTIVNRPVPDPFRARYAWWVPEDLDLASLRLGADPFIGEHDFAAFCRAGPEGSTTVRRVLRSHWREAADGALVYEVTANAFCWQMVRSIVGTLVEVGRGRLRAGELTAILRGRSRAAAGTVAPPHGLCLWRVGYDE